MREGFGKAGTKRYIKLRGKEDDDGDSIIIIQKGDGEWRKKKEGEEEAARNVNQVSEVKGGWKWAD